MASALLTARDTAVFAYLQLMRPANILTAWADIVAGFAAAGAANPAALGWLLLATTGLYGGGIVFNDVFDAELDARERPERPIPQGRASRRGAALFGALLLIGAVLAAWQVSTTSAVIAAAVAVSALFYDSAGKHMGWFAPLSMALCRCGNLLLGISAVPLALQELWFLAAIPLLYIAAITTLSRGEVNGGSRGSSGVALLLLAAVTGVLLALGARADYLLWAALPFLVFWLYRVAPAFIAAWREPVPERLQAAVKAGVLSVTALNAVLAAGFGGLLFGLTILALLPVSLLLARHFAVT